MSSVSTTGLRVGLSALLATAVSWSGPPPVAAGAGDLDPSFADGGTVTLPMDGIVDVWRVSALAVDPDDGFVVSTGTTGSGTLSGVLLRFGADGDRDEAFGTGGVAYTDAGGCVFCGNDMALQPDGKVVVSGAHFSFPLSFTTAVARFNADGSVDGAFGSGGLAPSTDHMGIGESVALQPDGKILVASQALGITRLHDDGSVDTSWGGGTVHVAGAVPTDGRNVYTSELAVQPDGKVVAVGYVPQTYEGEVPQLVLVRLGPDGALDTGFGAGGVVQVDAFAQPGALALQPDGRIVVAGQSGDRLAVIRFEPDGSVDDTFGEGGVATATATATNRTRATAVGLRPDGRIVVAGDTGGLTTDNSAFVVATFTPGGVLDTRFGDGGTTFTDHAGGNGEETVGAVGLQSSGKILVAGVMPTPPWGHGGVAVDRYLSNTPPTVAVAGGGGCAGDDSAEVRLAVDDAETPAADLTVTATSSDTAVMADGQLHTGQGGGDRTLTLIASPRVSGRTVITVTVDDGELTATTTIGVALGAPGRDDLAGSPSADVLVGRQGDDTLGGGGGADVLCGGLGDDALDGGDGDDHLDGGRGDDNLAGGPGHDSFSGGPGVDAVADAAAGEVVTGTP
ncbi:MAG: hypothetical protein ACRD0R_09255 [Acidimicrobiales bacterium]